MLGCSELDFIFFLERRTSPIFSNLLSCVTAKSNTDTLELPLVSANLQRELMVKPNGTTTELGWNKKEKEREKKIFRLFTYHTDFQSPTTQCLRNYQSFEAFSTCGVV